MYGELVDVSNGHNRYCQVEKNSFNIYKDKMSLQPINTIPFSEVYEFNLA